METETIDATVEELSRDALLNAAHEADMTEFSEEESSAQSPEPAQPVAEHPPVATIDDGTKPDNSETEAEKEQRKRDEKGRFVPKDKKEAAVEAKVDEPAKEDSAFTKAQKERDRQQGLLSKFQQEKEQFRQEAETERRRLAEERAKLQQATRPRAVIANHTAEDYLSAANDWHTAAAKARNEGDMDTYAVNMDNAWKAKAAHDEIRAFEYQEYQKQSEAKMNQSFLADMNSVYQKHPESKYDSGNPTPLQNQIAAILETHPWVNRIPNGFTLVHDIATKMIEAASVPELLKQLQEAKSEIDRLTKGAQPARGGPTGPAQTPKFESMSQPEQRAALLRAAAEADNMEDAA